MNVKKKNVLDINVYIIYSVKKAMNCVLEHGAYSDKNFERQINKKGENYNNQEKRLLEVVYRFKKFRGEVLQKDLMGYLLSDREFLDYLRTNDLELYKIIEELIKNAS